MTLAFPSMSTWARRLEPQWLRGPQAKVLSWEGQGKNDREV